MTRQRFRVAAALYAREPWDVFAVHEIGTDRLHHAYWKHFDENHPDSSRGTASSTWLNGTTPWWTRGSERF